MPSRTVVVSCVNIWLILTYCPLVQKCFFMSCLMKGLEGFPKAQQGGGRTVLLEKSP